MWPRYQKTHSDTPGRQVQILVERHYEYAWEKRIKRKRDGVYRGQIKPRNLHNTPRPTLPKQDHKEKEPSNQTWTTHDNAFRNNRQLQDLSTPTQEIKQENLHEQHHWETPHKDLYLRILTSRPGQHVDTRTSLEVSHSNTTPRDNSKQQPGIYSINYHHLGRHHRGAHGKVRLRPSLILQLHRHRMDLQIKLPQVQTVSTNHSFKETRNHCNQHRNMNLWITLQRNLECNHG